MIDPWLDLQEQLITLRAQALEYEQRHAGAIADCPPARQPSARNLLHCLSVRQQDIRPLQQRLARLGFSALAQLEPHTLAHLNAVIHLLQTLTGRLADTPVPPVDYLSGPALLQERTEALFGPPPNTGVPHLMVALPPEAADPTALAAELMATGVTAMRLDCRPGTPWPSLAEHVVRARAGQSGRCPLMVTLAGPDQRTGPLQSGGRLLKLKPRRDLYGLVLEPCRIWLHSDPAEPLPQGLHKALCVPAEFIRASAVGDRIHLVDSRGQRRKLKLVQTQSGCAIAELSHTAYLMDDTELTLKRGEQTLATAYPQHLKDAVPPIVLFPGDRLILTRAAEPGVPEQRDQLGEQATPARIHCTAAAPFDHVQPGQTVWLDDGRMGGVVDTCDGHNMQIRITVADPSGSKLRAGKRIHFPDAELPMAALTEQDQADLAHAAPWADMVAFSPRQPVDLVALHQQLLAQGCDHTGIVLTLDTLQGFEQLPRLLLTGLQCGRPLGVIIARRELAVAVGFERLPAVLHKIQWLCKAAHVPVIWAAHSLDGLVRKGLPPRGDVSDANLSAAECVMLEAGPHLLPTVQRLRAAALE